MGGGLEIGAEGSLSQKVIQIYGCVVPRTWVLIVISLSSGLHLHICLVFLSVRMRPVRIRLCWLCRLCRVVLPILWHLLMRGPAVRRTKPRWSVADDTTGHTDSLPFCLVFLLVFASIIIPRSQPIPSGWGFWQAFSMSILP